MSRVYIFLRGLSLWQISDLKRPSDGLTRPRRGGENLQFKNYEAAKFSVNSKIISVENFVSFPCIIKEIWFGIATKWTIVRACFLTQMINLRSKALVNDQISLLRTQTKDPGDAITRKQVKPSPSPSQPLSLSPSPASPPRTYAEGAVFNFMEQWDL